MADTYGAITLPCAPPVTADDPLTDPKLIVVASFTAAVLQADLGEAWAARSGGSRVCDNVFAHDPNQHHFSDKFCPALFVWMGEGETLQLADDCSIDRVPLFLLWVFEPTGQRKQAIRDPVINGWSAALHRAFAIGRHRAWRHPNDTTTASQYRGSTLQRWAGLASCKFQRPRLAQLDILMDDGTPRIAYRAVQATLLVEEVLERDPAAYASVREAALALRIVRSDGDPIVSRDLLGGFSAGFSAGFSGGTLGGFSQGFSAGFH